MYALCLLSFILVAPRLLISYSMPLAAKAGAILATTIVIYTFTSLKRGVSIDLLSTTLLLLALVIGWPNAGTYHRAFRSTAFEAYVIERFDADNAAVIALCVTNARPVDDSLAFQSQLSTAATDWENKKEIKKALTAYDTWLDAFPRSAEAHLRRGRLRLYALESNEVNAQAAIKDFNLAIYLDATLADAYFYRAQAKSLVESGPEICSDLEATLRLDSARIEYVMDMATSACPELSRRLFSGAPDP